MRKDYADHERKIRAEETPKYAEIWEAVEAAIAYELPEGFVSGFAQRSEEDRVRLGEREGELEASGYTEPEAGEEDGAGSESEQP
jgi:hypothetical protein